MSAQPVDDELELLDASQIAALFKIPVTWVREQTRTRAKAPIPHLKLGKYIRFQEHAVRDWLQHYKKGYAWRKR